MKFKIETKLFTDIINSLLKILKREKQNISEISDSIFFESDNNKNEVIIKTNQLEFNVMYNLPVNDLEEGSFSISANTISNVLNSLAENEVTINSTEKKAIISTKTSTSDVFLLDDSGYSGETFNLPEKVNFSINREILIRGLKNVQHAASDSVVKPEIASVYMYSSDSSLYFVSTDTFRLAEVRFLTNDIKEEFNVLLPKRSVSKLLAILETVYDDKVFFYVDKNVLSLKTENSLIRMNSVSGNFPDYKNIIPKSFDAHISVLRKDVLTFLKKARVFASNLKRLEIRPPENKNSIVLSFENETIGSTENTIPAEIDGTITSIPTFNYKFIQDALNVIEDENIVFSVTNEKSKPIMIRGSDKKQLTIIISPLIT